MGAQCFRAALDDLENECVAHSATEPAAAQCKSPVGHTTECTRCDISSRYESIHGTEKKAVAGYIQLPGPPVGVSHAQDALCPEELLAGLHLEAEVIGHGGYGTVIKGTWKGSSVAVKVIISKARSDRAVQQELNAAAWLSSHPHICQTYATRCTTLTAPFFEKLERLAAVPDDFNGSCRCSGCDSCTAQAAASVVPPSLLGTADTDTLQLFNNTTRAAGVAVSVNAIKFSLNTMTTMDLDACPSVTSHMDVGGGIGLRTHVLPEPASLAAGEAVDCAATTTTAAAATPLDPLTASARVLQDLLLRNHDAVCTVRAPRSGAAHNGPCSGSHWPCAGAGPGPGCSCGAVVLVIMELCGKGTLSNAIRRGLFSAGPHWGAATGCRALVRTAAEVARALLHLHCKGVVHGDLKPSNVLLTSSRADRRGFTAKLCDFGLAQLLAPGAATARVEVWGTMPYCSPEAIRGTVSRASDVWAFGVLLNEALTCKRPYGVASDTWLLLGIEDGSVQLQWPHVEETASLTLASGTSDAFLAHPGPAAGRTSCVASGASFRHTASSSIHSGVGPYAMLTTGSDASAAGTPPQWLLTTHGPMGQPGPNGPTGHYYDAAVRALVDLGRRCTRHSPGERPEMAQVLGELLDIEGVLRLHGAGPGRASGVGAGTGGARGGVHVTHGV